MLSTNLSDNCFQALGVSMKGESIQHLDKNIKKLRDYGIINLRVCDKVNVLLRSHSKQTKVPSHKHVFPTAATYFRHVGGKVMQFC